MKKNILAIGMIALFIGMAVLPTCSALPPVFYIKAHVDGTVNGLHQRTIGAYAFRVYAHGPIHLAVETWRGKTYIDWDGGLMLGFSARLAKWDTAPQLIDPEQETYYVNGTVYICTIKDLES